jgi:hypothetical protein
MTDLTKMWAALAKYQPFADAGGHGDSWRVMCSERTEVAADVAWMKVQAAISAAEALAGLAAQAAAWAAAEAETVEAVSAYWVARAIKRIEDALKEREPAQQPLTDEEIDALSRALCRAIEKAHGIGGDK